jgi:CheY-like chemotaxis protein
MADAVAERSGVRVLVVEDEEAILDFVEMGLRYEGFEVELTQDGPSALAAFERRRPDLIILDLNLPKKDGREVLVELKEDPELKRIPVVVLTTSASDEDVLRAYEHHVNAYVRKPVGLDRFVEIVQSIDEFWLGIVTLPP